MTDKYIICTADGAGVAMSQEITKEELVAHLECRLREAGAYSPPRKITFANSVTMFDSERKKVGVHQVGFLILVIKGSIVVPKPINTFDVI